MLAAWDSPIVYFERQIIHERLNMWHLQTMQEFTMHVLWEAPIRPQRCDGSKVSECKISTLVPRCGYVSTCQRCYFLRKLRGAEPPQRLHNQVLRKLALRSRWSRRRDISCSSLVTATTARARRHHAMLGPRDELRNESTCRHHMFQVCAPHVIHM